MSHKFNEVAIRAVSSALPSTSVIVSKVIRTIYDESSSAKDLAQIIEHDPPLSARILKIANSAFYGHSRTINSIQRSVVVLGFNKIKELITTVTILHYLFDPKHSTSIDTLGLWLHSVGTAKAAQIISQQINRDRSDVAYTIGLLHDIGKILLALCFPDQYSGVVQLAEKERCRIILAERKLLNTDHTIIGKILCDLWILPEEISYAVASHHDLRGATSASYLQARITHLADYICRKAHIGNPGDNLIPKPSKAALVLFGSSSEKIKSNIDTVAQEIIKSKSDIENFFI